MSSRLRSLFSPKPTSYGHPELKCQAYDAVEEGEAPVKGYYPVAGNGPNVLEEIQRARDRRENKDRKNAHSRPTSSVAKSRASPTPPSHNVLRKRGATVARPRTAPSPIGSIASSQDSIILPPDLPRGRILSHSSISLNSAPPIVSPGLSPMASEHARSHSRTNSIPSTVEPNSPAIASPRNGHVQSPSRTLVEPPPVPAAKTPVKDTRPMTANVNQAHARRGSMRSLVEPPPVPPPVATYRELQAANARNNGFTPPTSSFSTHDRSASAMSQRPVHIDIFEAQSKIKPASPDANPPPKTPAQSDFSEHVADRNMGDVDATKFTLNADVPARSPVAASPSTEQSSPRRVWISEGADAHPAPPHRAASREGPNGLATRAPRQNSLSQEKGSWDAKPRQNIASYENGNRGARPAPRQTSISQEKSNWDANPPPRPSPISYENGNWDARPAPPQNLPRHHNGNWDTAPAGSPTLTPRTVVRPPRIDSMYGGRREKARIYINDDALDSPTLPAHFQNPRPRQTSASPDVRPGSIAQDIRARSMSREARHGSQHGSQSYVQPSAAPRPPGAVGFEKPRNFSSPTPFQQRPQMAPPVRTIVTPPVQTTITPVEQTMTPPVQATIAPPQTSVTPPVQTTITPPAQDSTAQPTDPSQEKQSTQLNGPRPTSTAKSTDSQRESRPASAVSAGSEKRKSSSRSRDRSSRRESVRYSPFPNTSTSNRNSVVSNHGNNRNSVTSNHGNNRSSVVSNHGINGNSRHTSELMSPVSPIDQADEGEDYSLATPPSPLIKKPVYPVPVEPRLMMQAPPAYAPSIADSQRSTFVPPMLSPLHRATPHTVRDPVSYPPASRPISSSSNWPLNSAMSIASAK